MSKKKTKNTEKKASLRKARTDAKRRQRNVFIAVACGLLAFFALIAIFPSIRDLRTFIFEEGKYIDPSNGKVYCAADISAYEIRTEFFPENLYGTMGGDKVYTIPGVKGKKWLVRHLSDNLFELYYEEKVHLPNISEFEPTELYLYVDAAIVLSREDITDETELKNIVSILMNGEKLDKPEGINEVYTLSFISEKYSHMYFCFEYVVTENGSYFYDHISFSYIKANGILDGYVAKLKGNSGE